MSRIFSPKFEVNSIYRGVDRDLQRFAGTTVRWYVFDENATVVDDTYDWGYGAHWKAPFSIPVIEAIRVEGGDQVYEQGLHARDRLKVVVAWDVMRDLGFTDLTGDVQPRLKDRIEYDKQIFGVVELLVQGQVQEMNTVVSISAVEVRPDELNNDVTFHPYAAP